MAKILLESLTKKDFRIEFYRSSGAGGQHRNKTDSACRITHIETGLSAVSADERKQGQNKKMAFRRLCSKLVPILKEKHSKALESKKTAGFGSKWVRTYDARANLVVDKRTGRRFRYEDVLNGDGLGKILNSLSDF